MTPLYEYTDGQPLLRWTMVVVAVGLLILGIMPLDGNPPVAIAWMVRSMVIIGPLLLILIPQIRLRAYPDHIEVSYGIGLIRFRLPNENITDVRAIKYEPIKDFGGWGIKGGAGKWRGWVAYTASITDKALAIETTEKNYLLGCPNPEAAATMLKSLLSMK